MSDKTLVERLREVDLGCDQHTDCQLANVAGVGCTSATCSQCGMDTAHALADAIEREYLPRPRFDDGEPVREGETICIDGELPLKVYWYSVRSDGLTVFSCPTSSRQIKTGERVKRPEPEVLDVDGVPIRVGDTVWSVTERSVMGPFKVTCVESYGLRYETEFGVDDGICFGLDHYTHKEPDSLERIESDVKKTLSGVFYKDEVLDLLRRQREVLERGHER